MRTSVVPTVFIPSPVRPPALQVAQRVPTRVPPHVSVVLLGITLRHQLPLDALLVLWAPTKRALDPQAARLVPRASIPLRVLLQFAPRLVFRFSLSPRHLACTHTHKYATLGFTIIDSFPDSFCILVLWRTFHNNK